MLVGSLLISAVTLAVTAIIARAFRGQVSATTQMLRETRGVLQPALVTVRSQADRTGALRPPGIDS